MAETDEAKLARQIASAVDKRTFIPAAVSANMVHKHPHIQVSVAEMIRELLIGWKAKYELGLASNPTEEMLGKWAQNMLDAEKNMPLS